MSDTTARTPVLVVIHEGEWIKVFGPENVDVVIVNMPYVGTVAGDILAEEWLDVTLPRHMAKIYFPGNLLAADSARIVRPSELVVTMQNVATLHTLEAIAQRPSESIVLDLNNDVPPPLDSELFDAPPLSPSIAAANERAIKQRKRSQKRRGT